MGRTVRLSVRSSSAVYAIAAVILAATAATQSAAAQDSENGFIIKRSPVTGFASSVRGVGGQPIVMPASGTLRATPDEFLASFGSLFGVADPARQLTADAARTDRLGHTHTTYRQVHEGVPVFSGVLKVHQGPAGRVMAANGDFYSIPKKLPTVPSLSIDTAAEAAHEAAALAHGLENDTELTLEQSELVIVDPGWYGDPPQGAHLAYYIVLTNLSIPLREAFFVDAHSGTVLDRWTVIHTSRVRAVYDGQFGSSLPGVLSRYEGDAPVTSPTDANRAYDYAGDVYDYFWNAFGRDSIDDEGMTLVLTVDSTAPPCPNAYWSGSQMVFCNGTVTDDITAHEIGHGVTERTANLIYQNQSGQLNESYSDIFGELIDLYNGDASIAGPPVGPPFWPTHPTGSGQDTPNNYRTACSPPSSYPDGVRWLMGEDATAFGGAIRDMWDPTCFGDPDYANSPLQTCPAGDSGGVHSGSGIPNHAFAILTDGKTYNSYTVTAIGPIKAAAVWYRALVYYLTPASDFQDAYFALNQAATDLIGTTPNDPRTGSPSAIAFTANDAIGVDKALLAVEMNTDGACGATVDILNPNPPDQCSPRVAVFSDDFEDGTNGWTVSTTGTPDTPYDWIQVSGLPVSRPGTAWFCEDLADGCPTGGEESAVHSLTSPQITMPAEFAQPTLAFTHYVATEAGYDGGNVKIRVNSGAWELIPSTAITYNAYNTTLLGGDNTNPIAEEPAWSGAGGGWGTTLIDLSGYLSSEDTVQVRFDFGKDYCNGVDGWYLDDLELYYCTCSVDEDCDDGLYCTGTESCVGGLCQTTGNPCGTDFCSEQSDQCLQAAFWDDFENGYAVGWNLYAPGSTAYTGDWMIGNPNGTSTGGDQAQPEDPFEGAACAFTAQNSSLGVDDVDDGVVYLMSPTIDLSGAASAELSFVRWFYNRDLGDDTGDFYVADVSSNNGGSWVNLETLGTNQSANTWTSRSFSLEAYISLSGMVKIRFGASDGGSTGNIIESAIDNVIILIDEACTGDEDCDDGNPCTDNICNLEDGDCVFPDNTDPCDDGDDCTIGDACSGGVCESGPPLVCDDGAYCNGLETCAGGSCVDGAYPCGAQLCDEETDNCVDCLGDPDCNDGEYCNGEETCLAGSCIPGTTPCGPEICDELNDTCDECVDNDDCDDLLYCNGQETCSSGTCQPETAVNCADSVACTVDSCDEDTDTCVHTPTNALCDNSQYCDGSEWCDAIADCQPGTSVDCNDGVACTTDSCDEDADDCAIVPVDALCDDGAYCSGIESCDTVDDCQPGTPVDCNDSIACTIDSCDEDGDTCINAPDDAACDNGIFCDGAETCEAIAGCLFGDNPCTGQVCNESAESCCPTTNRPGNDPLLADDGFGTKNRYMSFVGTNPGQDTAIRVVFSSLPGFEYAEGRTMWVQAPTETTEASGSSGPTPPPTFWAAALGCQPHYTDWTVYGTVDVYDDAFVPSATLEITAINTACDTAHAPSYSSALAIDLSAVGDVVGDCAVTPCTSPQGVVDFVDISAVVDKFRNLPSAPRKARADLLNSTVTLPSPDRKVDFVDISYCVDAFRSDAAALPGPPLTDPCQ